MEWDCSGGVDFPKDDFPEEKCDKIEFPPFHYLLTLYLLKYCPHSQASRQESNWFEAGDGRGRVDESFGSDGVIAAMGSVPLHPQGNCTIMTGVGCSTTTTVS